MKGGIEIVLIAVLVSSLGIQATIWNEDPKSFDEGDTYQFNYSSQVLTGLQKSSAEYNGLQLNSIVELTFKSTSNVIMALRNVELSESITSIKTRKPNVFFSEKKFQKLKNIDQESAKKLLFPVTFKWSLDKKISEFKANPSDDLFSLNIKRGILNMLNMKVKLEKDNWKEDGGSYVNKDDEGIDGVCTANYLWSSYPYLTPASKNGDARSLSVTRTKSANKCREPVGYDMSNFVMSQSPRKELDLNRTYVKNMNKVSMNITMWKSKKFFVWEAKSKSRYSKSMKYDSKESLITFVIQSLRFHKINSMSTQDVTGVTDSQSLIMDMSWPTKTLQEVDKRRIVSLVEKLGDQNGNVIPDLIYLLRLADDMDLKDILARVKTIVKGRPELLNPSLDVLAEVLTIPSTKLLIDEFILKPSPLIDDDNQMSKRISSMAGLSNVNDTTFIDLLTAAVSKPELLKNKYRTNTLKTTLLTIGALANSYYARNPKYDISSTNKYFTKIVMSLKSSMSKEETSIIVLKALGNLGSIESLSYLKKIANNQSKALSKRVQAIYSLRKMARKDSKIEHFLLKIFNDITEDVELRLAAGVDIVLRHKRKSTLYALVGILAKEPIKQVKSFMQDLIVGLSKFTKTKFTFRPLLQKLNMRAYSTDYSKSYTIPFKNGIICFSWIFTPDSKLPRTGNMIVYDFRFGKMLIPLEIGFRFENRKKMQSFQFKNFNDYISNSIKMSPSDRTQHSPIMTVYKKRYDNEIGFWSVENEMVKELSLDKFEEFIKYFKGEKSINLNYNLNHIVHGFMVVPTTIGFKYYTKVHSIVDFRLGFECSNPIDMATKSSSSKIQVRPFWKIDVVASTGIYAGYIKSEVNTKFQSVTPRRVQFTLSFNFLLKEYSLGFTKPSGDIHLMETFLEKKFKMMYFNKTTDIAATTKYIDINPFYLTKEYLRKLKTTMLPFPFGMIMNVTYFCDVGKPRMDGYKMDVMSAGDAYASIWIKGNKKSDLDEFQIEWKEETVRETRTNVVALKHIKNNKVVYKIDLMTLKIKPGIGKTITMTWPENIKYIMDAVKMYKMDSKKTEMKYMKLSGSIKYPLPIRFNKKEPFKVSTHKSLYSYGFTGSLKNPKGEIIDNVEIQLRLDKLAEDLGKNIAKNPNQYLAHDETLAQCVQDIELKIPNSPTCFNSWRKLNYFNELSVSLTWTAEGFSRFKNLYGKLNRRQSLSKYFVSESFNSNSNNNYSFTYSLTPYFYPSTIIKTSLLTLERIYKRIGYQETKVDKRFFQTLNERGKEDFDNKVCQLRMGNGPLVAIKTFDDYFYNAILSRSESSATGTKRVVIAQDELNTYQVSALKMKEDLLIQVISKDLSVIRIRKIREAVDVQFDNKKVAHGKLIKNGIAVASFNQLQDSIYGDKPAFSLKFADNIEIITDFSEMLDVKVNRDYQSTMRGICGNMDSEVFNEFTTANCTSSYASPENILIKSDYSTLFPRGLEDPNIVKFMTLKKCSMLKRLYLV